ncbi:hypothetical protein Taro_025574 [Colocasia esculenta]|uniref:Protein kinase domain-containing protein n=1 Tax=Colocasia esculenta TaxID=4460 RepID=A0A843VNN7_COLES|nr:hypothetical protein [Colocasia esculenta]
MTDDGSSWVMRASFAHPVGLRWGSFKMPAIPVLVEADRGIADLRPQVPDSHSHSYSKSKVAVLESDNWLGASGLRSIRRGMSTRRKQRSLSPLPTRSPSNDAFKEAKSEMKRFSTPHPRRKSQGKGGFLAKWFPSQSKAAQHRPSANASQKAKGWKESTWARCFDHVGGKVTAIESMEEWKGDLSKLYIGAKFASGGHSKLYHGVYKDQPVAVKVITLPDDDEDGSMATRLENEFIREVNLLSRTSHRNMLKLVAACRTPSVFCIITEYLSGGSLRAFLHKLEHKSLPQPRLIEIALDIARGMEYVHSQGIVHRDLKPENIIFDQESCAKIADFGIACEEAYCDALSDDPGTYRWMAPEMIKHKPYGRKVDVYSFGLLLWEMLTGRIPYEDMMPIQAAFAVVHKNLRPVIPSDSPPALRALIEQCWSLAPEKRPQFYEIVKILELFQSALAPDGTLKLVCKLTSQDHKKRLLNWMQKLKPLSADAHGAPANFL